MSFEEEKVKLTEECMKRREDVFRKYENAPPHIGMDGNPQDKELREITIWVDGEIKKLRAKYFK